MRQQEVFNKIGGIIRELNEQYTYMQSSEDLFNDLELELMAANAHFLSDHVEILRKISRTNERLPVNSDKTEIAQDKPAAEIVFEPEKQALAMQYFEETISSKADLEPFAEEALPEPSQKGRNFETPEIATSTENSEKAEETDRVFEFETKKSNPNEVNIVYELESEIIRHELIVDDTGEDWDEEDNNGEIDLVPETVEDVVIETEVIKSDPEVIIPEPVTTEPEIVKPQPVTIATQPVPELHKQIMVEEQQVLTLNERMSAQLASRKGDQLTEQPITDLKSAITLNDKLLFIKDLFHGYSLAYSEAIDILNRMHSFQEAEIFLKSSYATKNNWPDKPATADKFYALLQRRYI